MYTMNLYIIELYNINTLKSDEIYSLFRNEERSVQGSIFIYLN